MWKLIKVLVIAVTLNLFYYSFSWAFAPEFLNTKMLVALLGLAWFLFDSFREGKGVPLSHGIFWGAVIAALYSIVNVAAVEVNNTADYSYANYMTTFFVWIFGAYPIIAMLRLEYGEVKLSTLAGYLAGVSVFQALSALVLDNFIELRDLVDQLVYIDRSFFDGIDRLTCFSTALDPAGVRFSLVLIVIAAVLSYDEELRTSRSKLIAFIISFLIILGVGSMVSRTTSVGGAIGLGLLLYSTGLIQLRVRPSMVRMVSIFAVLAGIGFAVMAVLYNIDPYYQDKLRFAFEGFFSLVEKGEFKTSSTEKLNNQMWVWPEDLQTWIIGSGRYGGFVFATDIGYCRFILYSGLIGFCTFASMFVFYPFYFMRRMWEYRFLFLALLATAFIIWIKVSTDILMLYSFFLWFRPVDEAAMKRASLPLAS